MSKNRLEAFSDGVFAIIITIMVLELKVPHSVEMTALKPLVPVFPSYVLSFIYLAIYWNNHHHLFHAAKHVGGGVLWANLHLLFWLSLFPFATAWIGENHVASAPVALYGFVLFMAGVAYYLLERSIISRQGLDSVLASALTTGWKEIISIALYLAAIVLSFFNPWVASSFYVLVAIMWFVPDRRIERALAKAD